MTYVVPGNLIWKVHGTQPRSNVMFRRWRIRSQFLPSLVREGKWLIEDEPKYQTVVHTIDRKYGCRKQALATADIIDCQPVKHPASCASKQLISRAIIPQAITAVAGDWGKRGWETGTSSYPARYSAQGTLSFALI